MAQIKYVITDGLGIHARPAGLLVKCCEDFSCDIKIGTPLKMVDARRIMGVMGLGLKKGDELTMTFEGADAKEASQALTEFLKTNL
ncbi:MAG: HPr family phosphocarrier protein [Defluviitaleaceae bacterium]|nr:HPr family phosphocarrier protein [Defluviitaleaceae bacterium]